VEWSQFSAVRTAIPLSYHGTFAVVQASRQSRGYNPRAAEDMLVALTKFYKDRKIYSCKIARPSQGRRQCVVSVRILCIRRAASPRCREMKRVLAVPHSEISTRLEEHRKKAAQSPESTWPNGYRSLVAGHHSSGWASGKFASPPTAARAGSGDLGSHLHKRGRKTV
jgi:hypothetical protein